MYPISVVFKGSGRLEHRLNGLYRATWLRLPVVGERVRIAIDLLHVELSGIVCSVDEVSRLFDVSLAEGAERINRLLEKIRKEENLSVELE